MEKSNAQKVVEGFGLEYPNDAEKFTEICMKFNRPGATLGQFIDDLIEAFPEKKESILNIPMYTEVDGKLVRARLADRD